MKLTYTNVNGYLIPNLTYKSGEQMEQLGKYGFLRRDYLKNHRNSTYQVMLLQDTIGEHLQEVDKAAREREEIILKQLEEKDPLPDKALSGNGSFSSNCFRIISSRSLAALSTSCRCSPIVSCKSIT